MEESTARLLNRHDGGYLRHLRTSPWPWCRLLPEPKWREPSRFPPGVGFAHGLTFADMSTMRDRRKHRNGSARRHCSLPPLLAISKEAFVNEAGQTPAVVRLKTGTGEFNSSGRSPRQSRFPARAAAGSRRRTTSILGLGSPCHPPRAPGRNRAAVQGLQPSRRGPGRRQIKEYLSGVVIPAAAGLAKTPGILPGNVQIIVVNLSL